MPWQICTSGAHRGYELVSVWDTAGEGNVVWTLAARSTIILRTITVLFGSFVVSAVALGIATVLLAVLGRRVRFASRLCGLLLSAGVFFAAGWIAAELWALPPGPIDAAEVFCFLLTAVVVGLRPVWNPIGQLFMGTFASAALAYLVFAAAITVDVVVVERRRRSRLLAYRGGLLVAGARRLLRPAAGAQLTPAVVLTPVVLGSSSRDGGMNWA
jgi:hypothetical protein